MFSISVKFITTDFRCNYHIDVLYDTGINIRLGEKGLSVEPILCGEWFS
jgi:hypothetical protein